MERINNSFPEDDALFHAAFSLASGLPSKTASPQSLSFSLNASLSFSPISRYCRVQKSRRISHLEYFKSSVDHRVCEWQKQVDGVKESLSSVLRDILAEKEKLCDLVEANLPSFNVKGLLLMPPSRPAHPLRSLNLAAILPTESVAAVVATTSIFNFLNIYNSLLIARLILTWFPNPPEVIASPLSTICDPYLNLFRGIIPPIGGSLDFSPVLAFLVLNVFTNAASALPAEMPTPFPRPEEVASLSSLSLPPSTEGLTSKEQERLNQIVSQSMKAPAVTSPSSGENL